MQLLIEYAFPEAIRRVGGMGPEVCSTSTIAKKLDRTLSARLWCRETHFSDRWEKRYGICGPALNLC